MWSASRGNTPVVQDQDEISRLEGQLVVFRRLEVVERADLPHLLAAANAAAGVARGVRGQGPGLRLLLLLLQGQLDGCGERNGRRRRMEMGKKERGGQRFVDDEKSVGTVYVYLC